MNIERVKQRAVFLDRDGTLSEEVGYINHASRFQLFPYAATAIKRLNDNGWFAVLVTNQAGVARGYFSEHLLSQVHEKMREALGRENARLDGVYYCAHHPSAGEPPYRTDCDCRKPKPGLILRAASDLNIDLDKSWMIGDRYSDIELARNAGVRSAFLLSGYGQGEWQHQRNSWQHQPDLVCGNLLEAVDAIVSMEVFRSVS